MTIGITDLLARIGSHAQGTGMFEQVLLHEPKNAPRAPAAAIWVARVEPARVRSGLAKVSVLVTVNVRLYANMLQEPQDAIDRDLITALDVLMTAYVGDFELGDENRTIDLFGSAGTDLDAEMGYLEQNQTLFRVCVITLPVLINDVWDEVN